jgi:hypothetical protein
MAAAAGVGGGAGFWFVGGGGQVWVWLLPLVGDDGALVPPPFLLGTRRYGMFRVKGEESSPSLVTVSTFFPDFDHFVLSFFPSLFSFVKCVSYLIMKKHRV